jgi:hypothetical protein
MTVPISKGWINYIFLLVPGLDARASLALRSFARDRFGDSEGHHDSTWTIVNVRFDVTIQADPDFSTAELDSRANANRALPGAGNVGVINFVIGRLLQLVSIEAKPHVLPQFIRSRVVDVKSLPWLERLVFVIVVLERYSIKECSLLLEAAGLPLILVWSGIGLLFKRFASKRLGDLAVRQAEKT